MTLFWVICSAYAVSFLFEISILLLILALKFVFSPWFMFLFDITYSLCFIINFSICIFIFSLSLSPVKSTLLLIFFGSVLLLLRAIYVGVYAGGYLQNVSPAAIILVELPWSDIITSHHTVLTISWSFLYISFVGVLIMSFSFAYSGIKKITNEQTLQGICESP